MELRNNYISRALRFPNPLPEGYLRANEVNFGPITFWLLHATVFYVNFLNCIFLLTDTATACEHLTNTVLHYIFLILF